ncbi:hypothetical protein V6x_49260 [Gimesia chilikensis]|uniref:Uncharacterized protein n=1 Tax=Gimesia chilikensis TaxID=2605989 RepID=A0A517WIV9_9PLAN|nr:hypothetical protein [Gimesia chilikensis]QDU05190.1 hypothetical protein V6x_49260 [Gimesia chilikensis]
MVDISSYLPERTIKRLRCVESGTCVLLDPNPPDWKRAEITAPRELAATDVELLSQLLLDPDSWYRCKKRCLPSETAIISLEAISGKVNVFIDMSCAGWRVLKPSHAQSSAFFDPVYQEVRSILQRTFPELASPHSRALWKQGVIQDLCQKARRSGHDDTQGL